MKPLRDLFYIKADKNKEYELDVKGLDGKPLYVDPDFNKYHHSVQCGEIFETPIKITKHEIFFDKSRGMYDERGYINDVEIKKGDKVYFHHFVIDERSRDIIDGQEIYRCLYNQIYCIVRDGEIIPIEKWVLVEPILEDESNIKKEVGDKTIYIKSNQEIIKNTGIIKYLTKEGGRQGLSVGSKVYFKNDADYEIKIEGKVYYRMKLANILLEYVGN